MDKLDKLKENWQSEEHELPKVSFDKIYKILLKKSSSIVKWILIIGIVELLFWSFLNLLVPDSYFEVYEKFHLKTFLYVTQVFHYAVVLVFIYLFYKNYKAISVVETTNKLMQKIIKTRKTVNYYVYYNIALYVVLSLVVNIIMFSNPEIMVEVLNPKNNNLDESLILTIMIITQVVALFIIIGLLWLYYRIIYGILLKRLSKNYKELKSIK